MNASFRKIKTLLAKALIYGIDRQKAVMPLWLSLVISFVLVGVGPIYLGFRSNQPIFGFLLALITFYIIMNVSVKSQIHGAIQALDPPKTGNTRVKFKVDNKTIWQSEKINFEPASTNRSSLDINVFSRYGSRGGRPGRLKGGLDITNPDVLRWHKEAYQIYTSSTQKEFLEFCRKVGENESTVRSRFKKYRDQLL